jgi:hypothetical protein
MQSSFDPKPSCFLDRIALWVTSIVQIEPNAGCPTDGCRSVNPNTLIQPNKMISPPLLTGIENGYNLLSFWINASYKVVTSFIATATGKRKVITIIRAAQGFGDDMIDCKVIGT